MFRFLLKCFLWILLLSAVWEVWLVWGPRKESPIWKRADFVSHWKRAARGPSVARTWTDISGRTLNAVATAADEESVQIRVTATETVYALPLARLSPADQDFVAEWRHSSSNPGMPDWTPPAQWAAGYDGGSAVAITPVERIAGMRSWHTPRYELQAGNEVDPDTLAVLAMICESVDGACRASPLPLLWGRESDARRIVKIHPSESAYTKAGGPAGTAGCFFFANGEVHICEPRLQESDFLGRVQGYSLQKRQKYVLLVHELVHQATIGVSLGGFPAWIPEGLAEYFAAVQRSPGRFQFRDSHLAVKAHLISSLPLNGFIQPTTYPVWNLDSFLDRSLTEWNGIVAKGEKGGRAQIQYIQALALFEYFAKGDSSDGRHLRAYLEAVLTGAEPAAASRLHLLRGRSHAELERAIRDYWTARGLPLRFVAEPSMDKVKIEYGVGLDSRL